MPVEGRRDARRHPARIHLSSVAVEWRERMRPFLPTATALFSRTASRGRAGQARARHLHLRELRQRMGPRSRHRREFRGGLRLRRAFRRRGRRRVAPLAAASGGRAQPRRHRARPRHQPHGGGDGDRSLPAARHRGTGPDPPRRMVRSGLPALRLGLFRLRARRGSRRCSREFRGAGGLRHDHRHPRSAQLHARSRPADVGQGGLWRPRSRDLGRPRRQRRHCHAGLVRGLRPVPRRRGRHGARLYDLARLPPDRRGRPDEIRRDVRRGA